MPLSVAIVLLGLSHLDLDAALARLREVGAVAETDAAGLGCPERRLG